MAKKFVCVTMMGLGGAGQRMHFTNKMQEVVNSGQLKGQ